MQGDNLRKCFTFRCMTTGDRPVVIVYLLLVLHPRRAFLISDLEFNFHLCWR